MRTHRHVAPVLPHLFAGPSMRSLRSVKTFSAIGLALLMLLLVEVALQARSHWLQGVSLLGWAKGQETYFHDPVSGLKLLRPNALIGGQRQSIKTNRYGLRSDELSPQPAPDGFRAAVLGASSIMGAYAPSNELTIPGLLQSALRERHTGVKIEVINAGIAGLPLEQQAKMLDWLAPLFSPGVVIVYPGTNDLGAYCREGVSDAGAHLHPLAHFELPKWLLSVDLLHKNTGMLRDTAAPSPRSRRAAMIDTRPFEDSLNRLADIAAARRVQLVLATNARAYRREQPSAQQRQLAQSALFFNSCFDVDGLHTMHDRHNELILRTARLRGLAAIRIDEAVPGGARYFVDSSHFNDAGNRIVAAQLARYLSDAGLVH